MDKNVRLAEHDRAKQQSIMSYICAVPLNGHHGGHKHEIQEIILYRRRNVLLVDSLGKMWMLRYIAIGITTSDPTEQILFLSSSKRNSQMNMRQILDIMRAHDFEIDTELTNEAGGIVALQNGATIRFASMNDSFFRDASDEEHYQFLSRFTTTIADAYSTWAILFGVIKNTSFDTGYAGPKITNIIGAYHYSLTDTKQIYVLDLSCDTLDKIKKFF